MTLSNGKINGKHHPIHRVEWAVYTRTGGGFIATPDAPSAIRRYVWITEDGAGWYKELGQPPVSLGICKNITECVEKARKL